MFEQSEQEVTYCTYVVRGEGRKKANFSLKVKEVRWEITCREKREAQSEERKNFHSSIKREEEVKENSFFTPYCLSLFCYLLFPFLLSSPINLGRKKRERRKEMGRRKGRFHL